MFYLFVFCQYRTFYFFNLLFLFFIFLRNAEPFKDRFFQPYSPVFIDGWVPPEIILPHQEAAAKSVARIQVWTSILFFSGHNLFSGYKCFFFWNWISETKILKLEQFIYKLRFNKSDYFLKKNLIQFHFTLLHVLVLTFVTKTLFFLSFLIYYFYTTFFCL